VPVYCNLLWPSRPAALQTPRGDIVLGLCARCGFVYNFAFDPDRLRYAPGYENSLHFSPHFQSYAQALAGRLIAQYNLRNKDIIEIGCGHGDFLALLCELGGNRGVGFDPTCANGTSNGRPAKNMIFIRDFYSERYANHPSDFICCRHVLEHIPHPKQFLRGIRRAIGDRRHAVVFFEVPNVLFTLRDKGIWDIIYEHCSYFGAPSLAYLFSACGFEVSKTSDAFEGQFLCLEAKPAESREEFSMTLGDGAERVGGYVADFAANYENQVRAWKRKLEQIKRDGKRVVVWGAGSKGVTFLNTLKLPDQIKYVVDINPRKQGMFVAGTGQQIVPPEFLQTYRPDVVIVMNPIYRDEIRHILATLNVAAETLVAYGKDAGRSAGNPHD